ncbi:MAG: LPS export ABC transporter periplasmic protein LptC [candidate division Zixibacteria bacterium]|nr:LPS export ABC transporter periplasmic protein LptC [candidate division Zixibacteria bacterium]
MKALKIAGFLLLFLALTLFSCTKTNPPKEIENDTNYPDTQLDDATITLSKDGKQNTIVIAKHIDRWEKNDSTEADTVEITFFDENGSERSILNANRALIREKTEKISVFGSVVVVNDDSTILKTESLFWDPETELITTDDFVEIQQANGDILTGYGLRADRHLSEFEILRDVAGKVEKTPETEKERFIDK